MRPRKKFPEVKLGGREVSKKPGHRSVREMPQNFNSPPRVTGANDGLKGGVREYLNFRKISLTADWRMIQREGSQLGRGGASGRQAPWG